MSLPALLATLDRARLTRLSRRLLNHLCSKGIAEAQALLRELVVDTGAPEDSNQPMATRAWDGSGSADETFRIAAAHLSADALHDLLQTWLEDDRASFLLEALDNRATTQAEIFEALTRYVRDGVDETRLTLSMRTALRVALVRRFFSEEPEYLHAAKDCVRVTDFHALAGRILSPLNGRGRLGGKSYGLFLATRIVRACAQHEDLLADWHVPRTWYVACDGLTAFIRHNQLEDAYSRKYLDADQVRQEYPHVVQVFKHSSFPPEMIRGLARALDDFATAPLIVRSSSLLEERTGATFSGKYKSLFLANQGSKQERLAALMDAIAEVYASIFGPDPLEYRAERGLLDVNEEMAIMIQEVVGARVGPYFLPAFSGVAFSNNEFRWSPRIKRDDGLIRIVPGLGTRAVDRTGDDFPILIAPGQPGLRVNVTPEERMRYSPRIVDAINLETRALEPVSLADLFREWGASFPSVRDVVSIAEDEQRSWIVTFDGLTTRTPFVARIRALLRVLKEALGVPVDVEFASDGSRLYLLQCRPQSYAQGTAPAPLPAHTPTARIVFSASHHVSNGCVCAITHVVYVDPGAYHALPGLADLQEVGRAVGKLNRLLPRRRFILMGPGRWGSRDVQLGVPVAYSDINNTALLVEIARKEGSYVPDVSFGTHFFQDLVEAAILYLPLYPDEPGVHFNAAFLTGSRNVLADLVPEHARLAGTIRVIDVPETTGGLVLNVVMSADEDRALAFLDERGS